MGPEDWFGAGWDHRRWETKGDHNKLFNFIIIHRGQVQLTLSSGSVGRAFLHALVLHEYGYWDEQCSQLSHLVRLIAGLRLRCQL